MKISFFVAGIPAPGGSKRGFVNRKTGKVIITEDCKRSKPWRERVASEASRAYQGPPLDAPLVLRIVFYIMRPKSHYRTGKNSAILRADAPPYPGKIPDSTKLLRSTEDACTGTLWVDDSRITDTHIYRRFHQRPGAQIDVWEKSDDIAATRGTEIRNILNAE